MNTQPVLETHFYHDGRGPELQRVVWGYRGAQLQGFTYYNPDDSYDEEHLKHLRLEKVEAYMMASEEVHPKILYSGDSRAAIVRVINSAWLSQFDTPHVRDCQHYQISFYDEIYDVICKEIIPGVGELSEKA